MDMSTPIFKVLVLASLISFYFQLAEYKSVAEKADHERSKHERDLRDKDAELRQLEQLLAGEDHFFILALRAFSPR